ncbi:MAG: carbohydrate ABC transporter permease [Oscillospiraceae bacterium]|nr:carbohydrate ABC transporter permease [Oscillospiraceae bacterium]
MISTKKTGNYALTLLLILLVIVFLVPIAVVFINSFKSKFSINQTPFLPPTTDTFVGIENYTSGIRDTGFPMAFFWSLFITTLSVITIVVFTSMTAWYIVRSKSRFANFIYYLFVFSMIVPFQMVMFTMSKIANVLGLDNPLGIVVLYLGFGSGLSVFLFVGFVKSVPRAVEEAAVIDGCNPFQLFWKIVFKILRPTAITVAVLNAMWIWNDYLLPYLVIGSEYKTIPIAIQYLKGGYGSVDMGAMMAMLVLAILPVVVFYLFCQKYIIKGVAAGAVKG